MDAQGGQPAAGSYSRAERIILGPFRRGMAVVLAPVVAALARLGVPPTAVSLSQIPIGFAAAALIMHAPRVALGLFVGTLLLDAIDGALARKTGRESPFGALADQVSDHIREITFVGGLVAAGAMRGEIGVAYALLYPLVNFMLYAANRYGADVPLASRPGCRSTRSCSSTWRSRSTGWTMPARRPPDSWPQRRSRRWCSCGTA